MPFEYLAGDRVAAVSAAAGDDSLISVLLDAIPEEAKAAGVYSDALLKTRFEKVRDICKRVSWRMLCKTTSYRHEVSKACDL